MTIQHTVRSGETLGTIAKQYLGDSSKYKIIAAANPQLTNINLLKVGQVLNVPLPGPLAINKTASAAPVTAPLTPTSAMPVPQTPTPLLTEGVGVADSGIVGKLKELTSNKKVWIALAIALGAYYYTKRRR